MIAEELETDVNDYSDDASTFGDRIVAAREAIGLSSAELARRLGIKGETLARWEEDRAEPRANKLQMLAGVLNVSIIWLMSGVGTAPDLAEPARRGDEEDAELLLELLRIRETYVDLGQKITRLERRLKARTA